LTQEAITGKVLYVGKAEHAVMFAVGVEKIFPARPEDQIPSDSEQG
jgi:hypothetical protein